MVRSRILVVDDDPVNVALMNDILDDSYELKSADSGKKALSLLSDFHPDLILLDIMMPGMDGYEVCKRIKTDPKLKYSRVIIVSAKTMLDDRLFGYNVGADDYLIKPFEEEELLSKIKIFLKLKYQDELNLLKDRLLMLFSHETTMPLNCILGFVKLLYERNDLSDNDKFNLELIEKNGFSLLNFILKVRYFCGLSWNKKLSINNASLKDLLSEVINEINEKAEKKIAIIVSGDIDLFPKFNYTGLKKSLKYVITNAVNVTDKEGKVLINVINNNDEEYYIEVKDEGPGVDEKYLECIFDPFSVEEIMHHKRGQGLSLAIARLVTRLHGGELVAKNNQFPEKGATFVFKLPFDGEL